MKKIYFLISVLIVFFDQLTKYLVIKNIRLYEAIDILPFFRLVHVQNKGAAFGSFQSLGNSFFIVVSIAAIFVLAYLIIKGLEHPVGLTLILGGALGNLIDRVRFGYVIDFLDVYVGNYHWPAFNVADSTISFGIILMLITYIFPIHKKKS